MVGIPRLFELCGFNLLERAAQQTYPLKEHPQIPNLVDILTRKNHHHINLIGAISDKIKIALLEGLASHLLQVSLPLALRHCEFFYLDLKRMTFSEEKMNRLNDEIFSFCEAIHNTPKKFILAITDLEACPAFIQTLNALSQDDKWRIITFNSNYNNLFASVRLQTPSKLQLLNLLKQHKTELEQFHKVLIPEETCLSALSMTAHYLTNVDYFDKALHLLDSAAARASSMDIHDSTLQAQQKPVVSTVALSHVISHWTQIPLSNLHNNSFQVAKFVDALERHIYGQDAALGYIASVLQHAYIKLQDKAGPLCSFLFVGTPESGKKTTAVCLAEHLFGHKNALLRVNLNESGVNLSEITVTTDAQLSYPLLSAVRSIPYAILLFENISEDSLPALKLFQNIWQTGYAIDERGRQHDFKHTIFILTTNLTSDRIATLMQAPTLVETNKSLDLMQLVLNEPHTDQNEQINLQLSLQDISEELLPSLEAKFGEQLLQSVNIVPFMPLDYQALEKIIRDKVKLLAKKLELNYSIELGYSPEVIKFLAHEAFWRKPLSKSIDKVLEQHLYGAVASEILAHADDKHKARRLVLRLNDEGQLLRCETGTNLSLMF